MAIAVHVPGPALIRAGTGAGGALADAGYTQNGADLSFDGYFQNVPCDSHGGDDGPPAEVLFHGETARIRIELTKWDSDVINILNGRLRGLAAPGTPSGPGVLMFAGEHDFRLLILTATLPYNFPRTIIRAPIEMPRRGSKFSIIVAEFEAHKDANGVLWNRTST